MEITCTNKLLFSFKLEGISIIIQHNIPALNTLRYNKQNNILTSRNIERLSSGYLVNRAADDASGLAISEKMRGQIRGLHQAQKNNKDAISIIKTADGAMQEGHNILQRIRELLVQSSNGTYQDNDRSMLQKEINHLLQEIDDISYRTHFNGIKLLSGNTVAAPITKTLSNIMIPGIGSGHMTNGYFGSIYAGYPGHVPPPTWDSSQGLYIYNGAHAILDFSQFTQQNAQELVGQGFSITCCTNQYNILFNDTGRNEPEYLQGSPGPPPTNNEHVILHVDISNVTNGEDLVDAILSVGGINFIYDHIQFDFVRTSNSDGYKDQLLIYDTRNGVLAEGEHGRLEAFNMETLGQKQATGKSLYIQVGANWGERIHILLPVINTETLMLGSEEGEISVMDGELAAKSIQMADRAIKILNEARTSLGAIQNRLEHTLNNIENARENLTSSESTIRDADMAKEMSEFTRRSILLQSSQAMLAQVNMLPQNVLLLIKQ